MGPDCEHPARGHEQGDHDRRHAGFEGTNLTVFGALDNTDPLVQRQGRYDIIVVLEGPPEDVVVRPLGGLLGGGAMP